MRLVLSEMTIVLTDITDVEHGQQEVIVVPHELQVLLQSGWENEVSDRSAVLAVTTHQVVHYRYSPGR